MVEAREHHHSTRRWALLKFSWLLVILSSISTLSINKMFLRLTATYMIDDRMSPQETRSRDESAVESTHNGKSLPLRRLAVASFLDNGDHLYGAYCIKSQLEKFNMTAQGVDHVAVVPDTFPTRMKKEWDVVNQMFDKDNIYQVNKNYIHDKLTREVWKGSFNKLWLFNLTAYDKIIVLDLDVLIRTNIMHWFDYPTPCATQANDNIEWNSGAMVISPNTDMFDTMVKMLPNVTVFDAKKLATENKTDNFNSGVGQQGFLSAFFTHKSRGNATSAWRMKTMPTEASVLSSSLGRPQFRYFAEYRRHIFETVHFTTCKPHRAKCKIDDPVLCSMVQEWVDSMKGVEEYMEPLEHDPLGNCTKERGQVA